MCVVYLILLTFLPSPVEMPPASGIAAGPAAARVASRVSSLSLAQKCAQGLTVLGEGL